MIFSDYSVKRCHFVFKRNVYLSSIIRQGEKKGGGSQILDWTYARGGGGHSDAYWVQQGGWGGLKIRKKCVCN